MTMEAIGATLGYAVGIAVSPIPVAALILMLFTGRARSNSLAFLAGWVIGIGLVTSVVAAMPGLSSDDGGSSDGAGWLRLVLGLLLVAGAIHQWRGRPEAGSDPEPPAWMARIDDLEPVRALGLGFLLSAVNPKNLLLAAAAGSEFASLSLSGGEAVVAIIVFTLIAAVTVAVPVVAYLIAGDRLDGPLDTAKTWLIANNTAVMSVLFLVFGARLIGDAIQALA